MFDSPEQLAVDGRNFIMSELAKERMSELPMR